jgi:hypothetical protein
MSPLFSIVIPTRDRPLLLRYALDSALAQDFDDYEIVVSDNSSNEDTRILLEERASQRVRYVRTPRPLSMTDSWEFALGQARGRFLTYLCDDDALVPRLLPTLANAIRETRASVVTWGVAGFYHPNWREEAVRNSAHVPLLSGQTLSLDARAALRQLFDEMWPSFSVPKMLQSACSAALIAPVKARASKFFMPSCPDLSTAVCLLSQVDTYVHLDDVLMLSGAAEESTGANQWNGRAAIGSVLREYEEGELLTCVPLRAQVGINFVADTLMRARAVAPGNLEDVHLNWARYFATCYAGLLVFRDQGIDVTAEIDEFWQVLAQQSVRLQQDVRAALAHRQSHLFRRQARRLVNASALLRSLEQRLRPSLRRTSELVLLGSEYGFSNIAECADMVDTAIQGERARRGPAKAA